jgi:hypothetical protein
MRGKVMGPYCRFGTAVRSVSFGTWSMSGQLNAPCNPPTPKLFVFTSALLLLLALSIISCVNSDELDFTHSEPAKADLIGRWIPVSETQAKANLSASKSEINLRGNGTFSAVDLPAAPEVPGVSPSGLLSGTGVWHIDKAHDVVTIWVINLDFSNHYRDTINIRHQRAPYLIHLSTGEFEAILFTRIS